MPGTAGRVWRGAVALALLVALTVGLTAWSALPGLSARYYLLLPGAGFPVRIGGRGVRVTGTMPGMPAAGVVARGDVVIAHDGRPVRTVEELTDANRRVRPGEEVSLRIRRGGEEREVRIGTTPAPNE